DERANRGDIVTSLNSGEYREPTSDVVQRVTDWRCLRGRSIETRGFDHTNRHAPSVGQVDRARHYLIWKVVAADPEGRCIQPFGHEDENRRPGVGTHFRVLKRSASGFGSRCL